MALTATMRRFEVTLADSDRGVYETLDLRVAQHPSESDRFLVARLVARALEHAEGIAWSKGGVSSDEEPALSQRDLRGDLTAWIEVGLPTPPRLHKASKAVKRVVVYGWNRMDALAASLVDEKVFRADRIELFDLDPDVLDAIAATVDRNNTWELAVTGGVVYLATGSATFELPVRRVQ
jgi:uncharacterized protein YaeQ